MAQEEQVLVVERQVLEQTGMFQGLTYNVEPYLRRLFVSGVPRFMPRSQAEIDPTYKQLIPYVIITYEDQYLSYVRGKKAGEKRLLGLRSIGIGGHINPADDNPLFSNDLREAYLAAVQREVAEEVIIEAQPIDRVVALINDDSNEVGQVHLGIVHFWILDAPRVSKREQMITQMNFMSLTELQAVGDSLETWSKLCLEHLTELARHAQTAAPLAKLFSI